MNALKSYRFHTLHNQPASRVSPLAIKMMATYLEQNIVRQSTGAGSRDILNIWKDVNESKDRPSQVRNAHTNLKWWLESHFPSIQFEYSTMVDETRVIENVVGYINRGMPVLMSVSHARVAGHIVLVVGYENYQPLMSTPDFHLVVHDPYGRFDPSLLSNIYGGKRWEGEGMSLVSGGQSGPGQNCRLPLTSVGRQRSGDTSRGTYYLLSGK